MHGSRGRSARRCAADYSVVDVEDQRLAWCHTLVGLRPFDASGANRPRSRVAVGAGLDRHRPTLGLMTPEQLVKRRGVHEQIVSITNRDRRGGHVDVDGVQRVTGA